MNQVKYQLITVSCLLVCGSGCLDHHSAVVKPAEPSTKSTNAAQTKDHAPSADVQSIPAANQPNSESTKAPTMVPAPTNLIVETIAAPINPHAPTVRAGQTASVQYTGWLWDNGQKGRQFDSSRNRVSASHPHGTPFSFKVGAGMVIGGWDQGLQQMQVGGQYRLIIPAHLGYGARGAGALIPPHAPLIFDIEVLDAK